VVTVKIHMYVVGAFPSEEGKGCIWLEGEVAALMELLEMSQWLCLVPTLLDAGGTAGL